MVSDCRFEYGLTEFYGTSALCTSSPGAGESPVAMSTVVEGLSESTTVPLPDRRHQPARDELRRRPVIHDAGPGTAADGR